jgi:hypothetical protein
MTANVQFEKRKISGRDLKGLVAKKNWLAINRQP